jgi:hypothetical protein
VSAKNERRIRSAVSFVPNHKGVKTYTLDEIRYGNPSEKLNPTTISPLAYELLSMDKHSFVFNELAINYGDHAFFIDNVNGKIHCPFMLPCVEHEIAHIVEMNDLSRICLPDWGMGKIHDGVHKLKTNPKFFFAAVAREIRVRNIQKIISGDDLNMRVGSKKDNAYAAVIKNSYSWIDPAAKFIPFGRFRTMDEFYDWTIHLAETTLKNYSIERIRHEWDVKLNIMREYMYTCAKTA